MGKYSNFEDFGRDALKSEELPTIVGGIEENDDLTILSDIDEGGLHAER